MRDQAIVPDNARNLHSIAATSIKRANCRRAARSNETYRLIRPRHLHGRQGSSQTCKVGTSVAKTFCGNMSRNSMFNPDDVEHGNTRLTESNTHGLGSPCYEPFT